MWNFILNCAVTDSVGFNQLVGRRIYLVPVWFIVWRCKSTFDELEKKISPFCLSKVKTNKSPLNQENLL